MPDREEWEEEIDLREYINIILKRKILILSIFFISVITTTVVNFLMPKSYEISMIIEPPKSGVTEKGEIIYLDSGPAFVEVIKTGVYNLKILEKIGNKGLDISCINNINWVKVSLNINEKMLEQGKEVLNTLFELITSYYQKRVEHRKELIAMSINGVKNAIAIIENNIEKKKQELKILNERKVQLEKECNLISKNTQELLLQRDSLLKEPMRDRISELLFATIIQQNIGYFNSLRNELSNLLIRKREGTIDIKNLRKEIENKNIEIEKINLAIDSISNITMIQEPTVSVYPIGPKRIRNIAIASILSLMFGVFLPFFMEFWRKIFQSQ